MNRRGTRRDPDKDRFWRDTLHRQRASGLSVREFCTRHNLAKTASYSWRAEIQRRDRESGTSTIPMSPARSTKHSQPEPRIRAKKAGSLKKAPPAGIPAPVGRLKFLPVAVTNVAATSLVEIALPSGVVLRVGHDCDRQTLRTVLGAVLRNNGKVPAW